MGKTANLIFCFIMLTSCSVLGQLPENVTSFEEIETRFENNKVYSTYSVEVADPENRSTLTMESMNLTTSKLNLLFHSEVEDTFSFYINDQLVKTVRINSIINSDGELPNDIPWLFFDYPNGQNTATLKVTSNNYGGFETEMRKEYPMLYIKYFKDEWYLNHNTIYKIPFDHFLVNEN